MSARAICVASMAAVGRGVCLPGFSFSRYISLSLSVCLFACPLHVRFVLVVVLFHRRFAVLVCWLCLSVLGSLLPSV